MALILNAIFALPAGAADADDIRGYPTRSLHLIVAFPAGTAVDGLTRLVGSRLEQSLGQPVVVENRPGAGGNMGTTFAARTAPDGYTLAIIGASVTINPALHGDKVVAPAREFAPVIRLTAQPIVLVAHPSVPAVTMAELVELARRKPGALAYSTPGIGTPTHIAAELVAQHAGIEWLHVPYSGSGPILKDALSGEVPLSFTLLGGAEPYLRAGQLKAIAVTSERRVSALPSVPTIAESALPGYEITSWHGIVAPARTPQPIVEHLQRALATIVAEPDVVRGYARWAWSPQAARQSPSRRASSPKWCGGATLSCAEASPLTDAFPEAVSTGALTAGLASEVTPYPNSSPRSGS